MRQWTSDDWILLVTCVIAIFNTAVFIYVVRTNRRK